MIYVNFGKNSSEDHKWYWADKGAKEYTEWTSADKNPIFYYDRHDLAMRNLEFRDFVTEEMWEHFRTNEEALIVINFADDYINSADLDRFASDIKLRNVDSSRVIFVLMDQNFIEFVVNGLAARGINNISADYINILMKRVPPRYNDEAIKTHKFSIFSRNYWDWRFDIYLELLKRGVLANTNFSFHNYNPYTNELYDEERLKADAIKKGHVITQEVEEFIKGVPYDLGSRSNKFSDVIYEALNTSDYHIVVESHFDPFLGINYEFAKKDYNELTISPGFITEKVWKPIACKRPFFIAATPFILRDLKKLGYKTFGEFIDESYDEIVDDKQRLLALTSEIERINNLPTEEYNQLLASLQNIVEYNHSVYINQWENVNFTKYPFLHGIVVL